MIPDGDAFLSETYHSLSGRVPCADREFAVAERPPLQPRAGIRFNFISAMSAWLDFSPNQYNSGGEDILYAVAASDNGSTVVGGVADGSGFAIKIDADANPLWQWSVSLDSI